MLFVLIVLRHQTTWLDFVVLHVVFVLHFHNHQYWKYHFHIEFLLINLMLIVMDHQMKKNEEYLVDEDLLELVLHLILHLKIIFLHRLYVLQMTELDVVLTKRKIKRSIKIFPIWNCPTLSLDGSFWAIFWWLDRGRIDLKIVFLDGYDDNIVRLYVPRNRNISKMWISIHAIRKMNDMLKKE